jgi:hypothetical protein
VSASPAQPATPIATSTEQRFRWLLTQERVDLLGFILLKAELIFDTADGGCLSAERTACLLTDLREQVCAAGAHDPFPDRPMFPKFAAANDGTK